MSELLDQVQDSLGSSYTIHNELGGGGMSRVYVARDASLRRDVVVKVLSPDLLAGVNLERFRREILVSAGLQHPHIVPVLASGEANGLPWFTMPLVEGESLRARIERGPLAIPETVGILREVGKALVYAHERGVVHRDIKPDNVLITAGTAVVTDFGIAKALSDSRASTATSTHGALTQLGTSIGTPLYMAPEQAAGDPSTDERADIYAFACMAYEMLAGRPPFAGPPAKLIAAHMTERPTHIAALRGDTPPQLAALVMQCLEKDPADRPAAASQIVSTLDALSTGSGSQLAAATRHVTLPVALAVWAVVVCVAWILAKAAVVGIGLPGWVIPGALFVAGLGLPVILFTAFVEHERPDAQTATTLSTIAIKARPHVSWRRTTRGGVAAFALFILVVATFMTLRALGIGPIGSLLAAGVIGDSDQLVVAEFAVSGSDTVLARALTEAIRTDLSQSNVVHLVPGSTVNQTLRLMQRPAGTRVDTGVARVIAVRTGAKAVLGGSVSSLGSSYVLTARLISPASGDPIVEFGETANDQRDLLPAVRRRVQRLTSR